MKKLLVALLLSVILTMTFTTPAFAGPPEDNPGLTYPDGPGWYGLVLGAWLGIAQHWIPGTGMGMYTIFTLTDALSDEDGGPPVKWQRGHWK